MTINQITNGPIPGYHMDIKNMTNYCYQDNKCVFRRRIETIRLVAAICIRFNLTILGIFTINKFATL